MLFMLFTDEPSLERAARLFPIRTGVAAPDWLIVSSRADLYGTAGVEGAGYVLPATGLILRVLKF